jgi:hypothetical protein
MEHVEARVFAPIIAKYSDDEIAKMSADEGQLVKMHGKFKILGEEQPIILKASNSDEIRRQIIQLCKQYHPRPLFVKLNTTLNRTFLVDQEYYQNDPNAILEIIHYSYDDKGEQMLRFILSKGVEQRELAYSRYYSTYGLSIQDVASLYKNKWDGRKALRAELTALMNKDTEYIYSELEKRFGVKIPSKEFRGQPSIVETYTTKAEIAIRDQGFNVFTVLNDYVREKGRFIQKDMGSSSVDYYVDYYRKVHPELIGLFSVSNTNYRRNEHGEIFK